MICVVVTLKVQPGKTEAFEQVFREVTAKVKANEAGCLLYQLTRSRTEPHAYTGLEIYRDQAALDQHLAADYFLASLPRMGACVDGEPKVEFLDSVE